MTSTIPSAIDAVVFDPVMGEITARVLKSRGINATVAKTLDELGTVVSERNGSTVYVIDPSTRKGYDGKALEIIAEADVPRSKVLLTVASFSKEMQSYVVVTKPYNVAELAAAVTERAKP